MNRMPPDRGLSDKKHSGVKGNKVCLTFALTLNADGSVKKEAFIIGKAKKASCFWWKVWETAWLLLSEQLEGMDDGCVVWRVGQKLG